jgi:hypothetical protein
LQFLANVQAKDGELLSKTMVKKPVSPEITLAAGIYPDQDGSGQDFTGALSAGYSSQKKRCKIVAGLLGKGVRLCTAVF